MMRRVRPTRVRVACWVRVSGIQSLKYVCFNALLMFLIDYYLMLYLFPGTKSQ